MMFSLLLRLQMLKKFVPGCTGWLRQMGLIVVTIKLFSLDGIKMLHLTCCSMTKIIFNSLVVPGDNMSHVTCL